MSVSTPSPPSTQVDAGVIEEARRRQHRRRLHGVLAAIFAAAVVAVAWLVGGASSSATSKRHSPGDPPAIQRSAARDASFNVRLYPAISMGRAGYCEAPEENGITGGNACGPVPTASEPFTMVYGSGEHGHLTTFAVTIPEVASILVNGTRTVIPVAVPGLPYGLRVARIETSANEPLPIAIREAVRREGLLLVAFDAQGHRLNAGRHASPRQENVIAWGRPRVPVNFSRGRSPILAPNPPNGACRLTVEGLPGLIARAGMVATAIRPFPGKLIGQAFLPCIETEYQFGSEPVQAFVMLNAADPSGRAAEMPAFDPVPGIPGFFAEGGTLTATRAGNAWLVVDEGNSLRQRIEVLRHLSASVKL
jgi:hypothetical protein